LFLKASLTGALSFAYLRPTPPVTSTCHHLKTPCTTDPTDPNPNPIPDQATLWLGNHLAGGACEGQTVLVVSHDRAFLDTVAQETVLFKDRALRWGWFWV
jgi:hypothetical protein